MQTKLLFAAILFVCCATKSSAQTQLYDFKSNAVPFNYKLAPTKPKIIKPFHYRNFTADTLQFSHQTEQGLIYIAPQDGMRVLRPYSSPTDYENKRTQILNPYFSEPFGKPSIIEPMPNPLNKALISEDKSK